ncbi:MAG TPA: cobyric acid synthase [Methanoregulaceae archaeon]|nr:MAG: cobyric acid synthase [Methanolinea sp.]HON81161.1 cobyric acid synthase [Methanoregulaceae archaeon]HPD09895.1 cobyric acid synthase [Methanoregulaceae archaeon]HRT14914.1 cobyric acid synthase [Methanoregulaceae archaeon]HRU30471.1 cobyric acid synthase [Methanoregulaceae archaeon]
MSLFVLGTASHVGKSTVVAAICRVLSNRGITAAPFKAQNMSLNSYVTRDGAEIGIAQAAQAFAARLEPEADMNPVLLKPKSEHISQVVLMGQPYRDISISDYYRETGMLLSHAVQAAERLMNRYGHIVAEGAGGAAELNLYDRDIANIRIERELGLPIILVADIERGGVFAQVFGTLELLPPDIKALVIGVVINKFRGDPALFEDGIRILEDLCGIPVLGVIPYLSLPFPSEDSLSIEDKKTCDHPVRIAVIRLPRISNFTDFESLERSAAVVYVKPGFSLSGYDCIIIPGTKNTVDDLRIVHKSGCAAEIRAARERGIPIIGICGGYQMLGLEVIDDGVESQLGRYEGLGLLRTVTRFSKYEKTTEQVTRTASAIGPILAAIGTVKGYVIHMGETERIGDEEAFCGEGAVSGDGLVIGTYLHGLFTNPSARNALLSWMYAQKGLEYIPMDEVARHDPYEQLAAEFERHLQLDPILALFES